jgi:hypothetical protein
MAELKWRSPVPFMRTTEDEREFIGRLIRWLSEQEQGPEYDLEANLAFGGLGVAERIFGFEGLITGYSAPSEHEILAAPSGPNKKVIVGGRAHIAAATGTFQVIKRKDSVDVVIFEVVASASNKGDSITSTGSGYVTLDAADESLRLHTISGTADVSYSGSYVDVD